MDVGRFSQEPSGLIIFVILAAASPIGSTANKIWNKLQQKKAHGKEQVRAKCGLRSAGSPAIIPLEQQAQRQHSFEKDYVSQSSRSTFNHVVMLIVANVSCQCWILSGLRRVLLLRHQNRTCSHLTLGQIFGRQGPHLFHLVPKHHSVHVRTNGYDFRLCCYHYYRRYQ